MPEARSRVPGSLFLTMVTFATLFLGLVTGIYPVAVEVETGVAAVEIYLDRELAGRMEGEPWTLSVDFGSELAPRHLTARALNARGQTVGEARQWINLPRLPAEVQILLERDGAGRPRAARLTWESLAGARPQEVQVVLDGEPLAVERPEESFPLPPYNPETPHLLTAELTFPSGLTGRAEVVFGGRFTGEVETELTAVPIFFKKGKGLPSPETLAGSFVREGRPLQVVAVEEGPAQVVVVRDLQAWRKLRALRPGPTAVLQRSRFGPRVSQDLHGGRFDLPLGREDRLRFIWPVAAEEAGARLPLQLFETSRDYTAEDGGLLWLLTTVSFRGQDAAHQRLADAVAVAGLRAAAENRRRAVVLVLGAAREDASQYDPARVRRYLQRIRVPLYVWSLDERTATPLAAAWGAVEEVSSPPSLRRAIQRLRKELAAQRIVWLGGKYLPQEIELSAGAAGIELIGKGTPPAIRPPPQPLGPLPTLPGGKGTPPPGP